MRILNVITTMDPKVGGPIQGIRVSTPELSKLNIFREVACFNDPTDSFIGSDPFPVHALGKGVGPWNYNKNFIPWLNENYSRFDVIVANGIWLYHTYAISRFIKSLKKRGDKRVPKFLIMPHGMLDPYFQYAETRKIKAIRNWLYWKLIEGNVINQNDGLLFTCETELLLARKTFRPYRPKRELNVGYGVDAPPTVTNAMNNDFFQLYPQLKGKRYILFLSRIHEKKGVDLLINAYKTILNQNPNVEIPKLVIAGPGLDTAFGKVIQQLSDNYIENIFFTGMLTGQIKWAAIHNCEVFILPSHQENFGIAIVEALACKKPVLISDQVNIWREIKNNNGGFVAPDTLDGAIQLLKQWLSLSEADRVEMENNAYDTYIKEFHILPAVKKYADALHLVVN